MNIPWTPEEFESLKRSLGMVDRLYEVVHMHEAAGWPYRALNSIQHQMYKAKRDRKEILYLNYLPNRDFNNLEIQDLISKVKDIKRPIKEIIKDPKEISKISNIIKRNPRNVLAKLKQLRSHIEAMEVAAKIEKANNQSFTIPIEDANTKLENIINMITEYNPKLKLNQVQALAITLMKTDILTVTDYGQGMTIAVMKT